MSEKVPFVDAHVHLWDLSKIHYPWLSPPFSDAGPNGSVEAIAKNYGLDDYLADAGKWNVVGAVHIDAGADAKQAVEETRWIEGIARERGLPSAIIAFAALNDRHVERLLESHAAHAHVRGIRHIVNWHTNPMRTYTPRDVTQDDQWWAGFGLLGKYGLSFDLQCYAGQMAGLVPLIARHPDIPVIVNHLGMPVTSEREGVTRWRWGLRTLADIPHVSLKLSGLGFIYRDWSLDRVRPFLEEAIDLFGPSRCMFASDTPTDKLFAPFDDYLEAYHAFAASYSLDERRDMFGRNANRIYRLGLSV